MDIRRFSPGKCFTIESGSLTYFSFMNLANLKQGVEGLISINLKLP